MLHAPLTKHGDRKRKALAKANGRAYHPMMFWPQPRVNYRASNAMRRMIGWRMQVFGRAMQQMLVPIAESFERALPVLREFHAGIQHLPPEIRYGSVLNHLDT